MKHFAYILTATSVVANPLKDGENQGKFMEYMAQYNKSYDTREEFGEHMVNFVAMDDYIASVNMEGSEYTHQAGHNKFSDWSRSEFKKLMGAKHPTKLYEGDEDDTTFGYD
jgi:hypothetical protein